MANHKHPFEGKGWYLVEGLCSFGNTADDFTGPFKSHQEALDKWHTYDGNDEIEILYVAADGFTYQDEPEECEKCGKMTDNPQYLTTRPAKLWALPEDCYPEEGMTVCPDCCNQMEESERPTRLHRVRCEDD